MKTSVLSGPELELSRKEFFGRLQSFNSDINNSVYSITGPSSVMSVSWPDCVNAFIESFKDNETSVKNLVLTSLSILNRVCPHAVELYLRVLCGDKMIKEMRRGNRVGSQEVIRDAIYNSVDHCLLENRHLLADAATTAGAAGHITVNVRSDIREGSVSLEEGFKAGCVIDEFFFEHLNDFSVKDCKVVVVNGKVIDVSEIHHILQESYETKQSFIIVSTGLSEDVSNTLFVNWSSGKTRVIPFQIRDNVKSINEIKDISVACSVQPCSNDTGIRISSLKLDEIPQVSASYSSATGVLRITPDDSGYYALQKLSREIRTKIRDSKVDDVKKLLNERLSKLCTRNVQLEVPGDTNARGILEDKINCFFSHISRCGSQGVIQARELCFKDYHVKYLPAMDAATAIKRAVSDRNVISNIRAVIKLENEC